MPCDRRDSRFPTFPQRARKEGPPFVFGWGEIGWAGVLEPVQNSHGQCWSCGRTRGPSTAHSGSLCEPEYCAQDDNVKRDPRDTKQRTLPPRFGFQRRTLHSLERPASSYFGSEWRALVEILVSHLSAEDAERWGSRRCCEVRLSGAGVLGGHRVRSDLARETKVGVFPVLRLRSGRALGHVRGGRRCARDPSPG